MFKQYKLVIFDLDGTLYEGTDHFDYYAEHLKKKVIVHKQLDFQRDYEQMKAGNHSVMIGKAYDIKEDLILTIDPMTLSVTEASKWNGETLSIEEVKKKYQEQLSFDFETMIAIGDGWWLPFVCAKHYGVEDCYSSYVATKEYMVSESFQLEPLPGLNEALVDLKTQSTIVLVTNSDADDVNRLLNELQLRGLFDKVITSAEKPTYTSKLFTDLLEEYQASADETLSIGDNFINDVAPAVLLGMDGVYIHTENNQEELHKNVQIVSSVMDCFSKS
ncbi:HAD family hydrolase [Alkalihalophilus lindianensis]|uniref:HAD family hydrolase n=1 Tax=Alkalihalophilus lindianensis TaxID=1630542 RepID=A0ABU3XAL8_9BACI|nr:HAD family hydrolase [Alkalihalophilus lindianensis]MDV2684941.1 HAD family hydrolase [Alkalihalophilus lindianensis]